MKRLIALAFALLCGVAQAQLGSPMVGAGTSIAAGGSATFNNVTVNGVGKFADGLVGAPSIAFTTHPTYGIYYATANNLIAVTYNGTATHASDAQRIRLKSSVGLEWSSGDPTVSGSDVAIWRNAAGLIEVNSGAACSTVANCRDLQLRHVIASGTIPTMGACGTTPSVVGGDSAMLVTTGSGGVATTCAVTFAVAYANAPICIALNDTDRVSYSMVTTTGGFTITATAAFTAGSKFHVQCVGRT